MKYFFVALCFCVLFLQVGRAEAQLVSGSTQAGTISAGGTTSYTFSANATQGVAFSVAAAFNIRIAVYKSDGTLIGSDVQRYTPVNLPATDTYTVKLTGTNAAFSGPFTLYYVRGGDSVSNGTLSSGVTATGSLPAAGLISYQFHANMNDVFQIAAKGPSFSSYVLVYKPDGSYLNFDTNGYAGVAPVTGTYTIVMEGIHLYDTGSFNAYLIVGESGVSDGDLVSGTTASGTMPANGIVSFNFDGSNNDQAQILIDIPFTTYLQILKPDGTSLVTDTQSTNVKLTANGKYIFYMRAASAASTGNFNIYYAKGNDDVSEGFLTNSGARPGTTPVAGMTQYQVQGTAGTPIVLSTTSAYSHYLYIMKPDGTYYNRYTNGVTIPAASVTTGLWNINVTAVSAAVPADYTISATTNPTVASTNPSQSACSCNQVQSPDNTPTPPSITDPDPSSMVGNPINVDVGYKSEIATDYNGPGLAFTRIYRSDLGGTINTFGSIWRHNYARSLSVVTGSTASITDGTGVTTAYTYSGGVWVPDLPYTRAKLQNAGTGYTYTLPNNTVERYDSNKRLTRIEYLGGGAINLVYDGSGRLSTVTNENGRQLTLTYDASNRVSTLVTPDGTFTYGYDSYSNLTTVTRPDTKVLTYVYANPIYPYLTGITDENGNNYATFGYTSGGKANSTEHAGATDKYSVTYYTDTTTSVTNPLGKNFVYNYVNKYGLRHIIELDGLASTNTPASARYYNYDKLGRVIGLTDWQNNTTRFRYDSRGNITRVTEATGTAQQRITYISYIAAFNLPDLVKEPGKTTDYDYDAYGRLTKMTVTDTATAATRITNYTYYANGTDPSGNVILGRLYTVDGPRTDVSDVTTYGYDANYNLTTVTNPLSQVTTITARDAAGRPTTVQDANGINTVLTYDSNGWLKTATRASGTALAALYQFDYDFDGNLTKVTLPNAVYVNYSYDNARRLTGITDALGNTVTYTLNSAGNATKAEVKNTTPAQTYVHNQTFDELARLLTSIGAATPAQTALFGYDKNSNLTSYTDPKANPATTYAYDALQRLSTQADALSGVTTLGYTGLDDVNSVKDQRNNITSYTYNAFGDVTAESSPDRGSISYVVDKAGNVTQRTDARSVVTNFTYDALNRPLTVAYPSDSSLNATLTYDSITGCGTPYKGHLCQMVDASGTTKYQYDSLGRVTSVGETRGALTFNQSYTYDLAGNIATMTMPSGRVVTYTRNANGLVSNVAAPINGTATNLASSITYLPFGPLKGLNYGNSLTLSATFDTDYNPTNRTISGGIANWTYTTDKNSNITQAGPTTYGYDALDRVNGENGATTAYTYDATSNRLTKVQGTTTTTTVPAANNKISAVGGTAYSYDAAGNITAIGANTYGWNAAGLLGTYNTTGGVYTYNAYNQRTKKVVSSVTTQYVYGPNGLLAGEYSSTGVMQREYIYLNDEPLAQVTAGSPETVAYLHADHLGTPRFATNSAGSSVWSWTNDAFGGSTPSGSVTVNLRMPGQYFDSESGLFYNWNRYYNPAIGRYISSDPIGLAGGLNMFNYANVNPIIFNDLSGNNPSVALTGTLGGTVSTGGEVVAGALTAIRVTVVAAAAPLSGGLLLSLISTPAGEADESALLANAGYGPLGWKDNGAVCEMTAKGNQADSKIVEDFAIANSALNGGPRDRCKWLEDNADNYTPSQVKMTEKAWGCRPSRVSKDKIKKVSKDKIKKG